MRRGENFLATGTGKHGLGLNWILIKGWSFWISFYIFNTSVTNSPPPSFLSAASAAWPIFCSSNFWMLWLCSKTGKFSGSFGGGEFSGDFGAESGVEGSDLAPSECSTFGAGGDFGCIWGGANGLISGRPGWIEGNGSCVERILAKISTGFKFWAKLFCACCSLLMLASLLSISLLARVNCASCARLWATWACCACWILAAKIWLLRRPTWGGRTE